MTKFIDNTQKNKSKETIFEKALSFDFIVGDALSDINDYEKVEFIGHKNLIGKISKEHLSKFDKTCLINYYKNLIAEEKINYFSEIIDFDFKGFLFFAAASLLLSISLEWMGNAKNITPVLLVFLIPTYSILL